MAGRERPRAPPLVETHPTAEDGSRSSRLPWAIDSARIESLAVITRPRGLRLTPLVDILTAR